MIEINERITIRQAGPDDAVLVSVLASTTFYEAYSAQDESANLAAYIHNSFNIETVRSEIDDPNSTFLLVFLERKAVGYVRLIEDSRVDGVEGGSVIELRRIYILERAWNTGIGKALLDHCIGFAQLRKFDALWLGVWEENVRARSFYEKHEFREVGKIKFPYGDVVGTNLVLVRSI
jgi:ribosomal protein S18 acetylase RimI-like enzyme